MKDRVGAALIVQFTPADSPETTTTVELDRLRILLVDVDGGHAALGDDERQQGSTDPMAAPARVDEKHLEALP